METVKIFTIYDTKQKTYSDPIADSLEGFEKYLRYLVNEANTVDYKFHSDFVVYHVANFNILSGELIPCPVKYLVNTLSAYGAPEHA